MNLLKITDENKVFSVKINNKTFKIDRYTNLAYFGNLLFKGIIDLKKAREDQRKLSETVVELEKSINIRRGRPLTNENKDDTENVIKNGREILKTRKDIIKVYKKFKREGEPDLTRFDDDEDDRYDNEDDGNNDEDDGNDDEDDGNDDDRKMPDSVKCQTKVSKNTFINLKNIDNLIDRIDKLDRNQITKSKNFRTLQ